MAYRTTARRTSRLALGLVAAVLLANLVSISLATLTFRAAVEQQGAETEALARHMLRDGGIDDADPLTRADHAQLMQARERAHDDAVRITRHVAWAELLSSLFGIGLGLVLMRAMRQLDVQERELQRTVERLRDTNRDLDAFAGRVAHDLRNALAPMRLASGLLCRPNSGRREVEKVAGILDRASLRMSQMIDALLQFSRAGADAADVAEVSDVVSGVLEELEPLARQLDVHVTAEVAPARIAAAPGVLHVLLSNLAGNAVKFLEDSPERRVTVRGSVQPESYLLEVCDTGPGVPLPMQARLFEPFFRVPGTAATGFGIGLATVRRIVDALQGSIDVSSEEGRGATFRVTLPLAPRHPVVVARRVPGSRRWLGAADRHA